MSDGYMGADCERISPIDVKHRAILHVGGCADLNRVIDQTMKEAGLTPGVPYEMDEKTLSATVRTS